MSQNSGETINERYIKVKSSAIPCKSAGIFDCVLRDKLISVILNGTVLDGLYEGKYTKTINELLNIALKKETNIKQIAVIADVNKFKVTKGHS